MQDFLQSNMDEFLPLRDVVFNTLRQAILTGELKPGERLMEIHLADRLGVSRTPIREAIRKLELEGLVTMIPRRGAEVAQITEKSMNDVLEVRRALDALCVELACDRITDGELENLRQACDAFEAAVKTKDAKKIAQASLEANRKGQKMREGTCSFQEWQQAQKMFDDLCKSSNFAACQRKSMDSNGLGSVSEIIMNIEINHHAECPEIHFPPDDIDKILADFAHTEVAIQ